MIDYAAIAERTSHSGPVLDRDLARLETLAFNPDQARDDHGRWSDMGSWSNTASKTASELSGVTPAFPLKTFKAYHVTTRENAEKILKEGFKLEKVKPRWTNDYAVSLSRGEQKAADYFSKNDPKTQKPIGLNTDKYALLEVIGKGRLYKSDGYGSPVVERASDPRDYTRRMIAQGLDGHDQGSVIFIHNPRVISSVREIQPKRLRGPKALGSTDQPRDDYGRWTDGIVDHREARGLAFNPDQERDDRGRWTSGAGFESDVWQRYPGAPDTRAYWPEEVKSVKRDLKRQGRLNADGTVSIYHATLSEPEDIVSRGLIPAFEKAPGQDWQAVHSPYATYFHLDRDPAERDVESGGSVIEARIPITAATLGRFIPDEDSSDNVFDGVNILTSGAGAIAFIGGVPASAVRVAKTNKFEGLAFNPDQARDDHGRWSPSSGSIQDGLDAQNVINIEKEKADSERRLSTVTRRATEIAIEMGVDPSIIHVVDKDPRPFVVGNQQFREAGHYNPSTGEIEINARNSYDDRMSVTNGIVAHEVFHAQYDAVTKAQEAEHTAMRDLPIHEFNRLFRVSGKPREGMNAEVAERFPASSAFASTLGDAYLGGGSYQQMVDEDGHSAYAKAYWDKAALARPNGFRSAVNETLAEVTRYKVAPFSWADSDKKPSIHSPWSKLAKNIRGAYSTLKQRRVLKGRTLRERVKSLLRGAEFNPGQPRDDQGQWTSTGVATDDLPENLNVSLTQSALSQREDFAVGYYTEEGFTDVNGSLRKGLIPTGPDGEPWDGVRDIDAAIQRGVLEKDAVFYRGVSIDLIDRLREGDVFEDKGFVSLTSNKSIAEVFADRPDRSGPKSKNGDVLQVRVPKGMHMLSTSKLNELNEDEYILGRGQRFRVVQKSLKAIVLEVVQ